MTALRLSIALLFAGSAAGFSQADEANEPRNLLVVTVEGLAEVGVPARGLDEILPDAEIRARVTPNCERLVAMGARFSNAFTSGDRAFGDLANAMAHVRVKGSYSAGFVRSEVRETPPHKDTGSGWFTTGKQRPLRTWIKRKPTITSIAGWEALADSQDAPRTAAAAVGAMRAASESPRVLGVQLFGWSPSPVIAGIFFDRFPLDQIALPNSPYDRRVLAARMGVFDLDTETLDAEAEKDWKRAIQAWLAHASALDYAIGVLVDGIETTNSDENPKNDWSVVFAATSSEGLDSMAMVSETGSRAELIVVAPRLTKPDQQRTTPIDLAALPRFVVELAGVDPAPLNEQRLAAGLPVSSGSGTSLMALPGTSLLPLLEPAGDRYDRVAITAAGGSYSVRSHRFRLVAKRRGPQQLFDLSKDPAGFTDLLDPNNAASIEKFGLSESQVESVRKWLAGELTHHLIVDQGDGDRHRRTIASLKQAGISPKAPGPNHQLTGDYNRDGVVNAADKTVWAAGLGDEVEHPGDGADGNHDGRVTQEDDEVWRANYGRRTR